MTISILDDIEQSASKTSVNTELYMRACSESLFPVFVMSSVDL